MYVGAPAAGSVAVTYVRGMVLAWQLRSRLLLCMSLRRSVLYVCLHLVCIGLAFSKVVSFKQNAMQIQDIVEKAMD